MISSGNPPSTPPAAPTIDRSAWGLLAALTALNVLNFVDRQLVVSLAPLLMAELGLSRTEIGLLVGASFIVVFAGLTLVLGAAADRISRPKLIALGLGVWSLATALSGTAQGFASLAALRVAVGIGEAVLSPAAIAMLGDRFPPTRIAFANAVYYSGIPVGFALSFALAGWIGPWLGWRACFFVLGGAGMLGVGAVLRLSDPPRRGAADRPSGPSSPGLARTLREALAAHPGVLILALAGAAFAFMSSSSQHTITWLVEERGLPYARAAYLSAAIVAGGGLLGNLAIGAIADRAQRHHPEGRLRATALVAAFAIPVASGFYLVPPSSSLFLPLWLLTQAWMLGWFSPVTASLDAMSPPGLRATLIGFGLLTVNLAGVATGPWVTGLIGDRWSLTSGLLLSLVPGLAGIALLLVVVRRRAAPPDGV